VEDRDSLGSGKDGRKAHREETTGQGKEWGPTLFIFGHLQK